MSKESKNERVQSEEGEGRKDRHWKKEGEDRRPGPDGPPLAEWIVAAVGLILVAGTIGFLVYQAIKGETLPPDVVVKVDSIAPVGSGYLEAHAGRDEHRDRRDRTGLCSVAVGGEGRDILYQGPAPV